MFNFLKNKFGKGVVIKFHKLVLCRKSKGLWENRWRQESYMKEEYTYLSDKGDFSNPNIGWKLHLNVRPKFVEIVSQYLIDNDYCHKYLSGGLPVDGKVFTVYVGSYESAIRVSGEISEKIDFCLSKPAAIGEIEFVSGVVGRFVCGGDEFWSYGSCGFSLLDRPLQEIAELETLNRLYDIELESFKKIYSKHGKYFYDEDIKL